MRFKYAALACISFFLFLPVTVFAEESAKVEGIYHKDQDPVVYTKDGIKIGNLKDKITDLTAIKEKDVKGTTPRKLVGIEFKDEEFIEGEKTEDNILWFRASNLKLSIQELPPCPEVPTRSASMERPIVSGIGCKQK